MYPSGRSAFRFRSHPNSPSWRPPLFSTEEVIDIGALSRSGGAGAVPSKNSSSAATKSVDRTSGGKGSAKEDRERGAGAGGEVSRWDPVALSSAATDRRWGCVCVSVLVVVFSRMSAQ